MNFYPNHRTFFFTEVNYEIHAQWLDTNLDLEETTPRPFEVKDYRCTRTGSPPGQLTPACKLSRIIGTTIQGDTRAYYTGAPHMALSLMSYITL